MHRERHRIKFVDNFKARLVAEIIDARDVDQVIEGEVVAAEFRNLAQISGKYDKERLAPKVDIPLQLVAQH